MIGQENPAFERNRRRSRTRTALVFFAAFILGGLILPNLRISWREPNVAAAPGEGLSVKPGAPLPLGQGEAYARAAQIAGPAVVNIDMRKSVRVRPGFFDDFAFGPRSRETGSEGSGVIIDRGGDVLTNEHVVGAVNEAGRKITVTLMDGRKFEGTVIGSDHTTDVALVHIEGDNLPVAQIGTARGLVPGQMAVAIGNPYGFRFTVTHGVVSALDRPVSGEEGRVYDRLIQTDCAINPGNSGGALADIQGRVIGVNTMVLNGANGIGFAIPIDTALRVADELKRYGKIKRPWLGLVVVTNNPNLAAFNNISDAPGAVVAQLYQNGPGQAAGLRPGDVLVRMNGKPVRSEEDYKTIEKALRIGDKVEFDVQRGGERANGTLIVGEAP